MPRHVPVVDHLPPEGSGEGPVVFDGRLMVDGLDGWSPSAGVGRHRGTYAPHGPYRAGDVVAGSHGLYMATRDIDADEAQILDTSDQDVDPGWVPRILLPSAQLSFGNDNPRGIQRTASPQRAAFLSRLTPEQVSLDPTAVSLQTVSDGVSHSADGLALEYEIPVVPGARPVAAQFFAFNDTTSNRETAITIQQLSDPLGAAPTHTSVGLGAAEVAPADPASGSRERPVMGAHVGFQVGSGDTDGFYSSGGLGSWPRARWLGVDRGLEPLSLGSPVVTLLVTAAPEVTGSSDVTARINLAEQGGDGVTPYHPAPRLVIHYAPDWEFLRPLAPRHVGDEAYVSATAVIDPGAAGSVIQPESGSFLVPPRAVYLLQLSSAQFVTEESRVSVAAPWLDAAAQSGLEAVMLGSHPPLAGITWDGAGGALEQPARSSVVTPAGLPNVGVNGAMLTDCIAFRNISEQDIQLPHLADTDASGFVATFA